MPTMTNKQSISTAADQADIFLLSQAGLRFINRGNLITTGVQSSTIDAIADDVIVQNFGDLTASGADSPTLLAGHRDDPVDGVEIYNFGSITNTAPFVDLNGNGLIDVDENFPDAIQYHGTNGLIDNRGTITVPTRSGAGIGILASDTTIINSGEIHANIFGIVIDDFGGGRDRNTVINEGLIHATGGTSGVAIDVRSNDNIVINEGEIIAQGEEYIGILLQGIGNHGENTGTITASGTSATAVYLYGSGHTFINRGLIEVENFGTGSAFAVRIDDAGLPAGTDTATFTNFGTIMSGSGVAAMIGSDGHETIINRGTIVGGVVLGGGNDTFLAGKGSEAVRVDLGDGTDLVILEKGFGTIRDTFVVASFTGGATSADVIDVSGLGISSFEELMGHASQHGLDVTFDFGGDSRLSLQETTLASLTPEDFVFADAGSQTLAIGPILGHSSQHDLFMM